MTETSVLRVRGIFDRNFDALTPHPLGAGEDSNQTPP